MQNKGEGMHVNFATLFQHVDEQMDVAKRQLNTALTVSPLDFKDQNHRLAEFQSLVRAKEVLHGRTLVDGHPVVTVNQDQAGIEAVTAALGRAEHPKPPPPHEPRDESAAAIAKKFAPVVKS